MDPENHRLYLNAGDVLTRTRRHDLALEYYRRGMLINLSLKLSLKAKHAGFLRSCFLFPLNHIMLPSFEHLQADNFKIHIICHNTALALFPMSPASRGKVALLEVENGNVGRGMYMLESINRR